MNYTILNNVIERLNFELKEKQLRQLYTLQEEKINKIGELFELGNVKPNHINYRYEYDVKDTMTNEGVYSYVTPQFKEENKANDLMSNIVKGVSINPFIEMTYDGNLYIDGVLDDDFLTVWQWELLNKHIKAQKDRAKNLFLDLYRESDVSWLDKGAKHCVLWFVPRNKIVTGEIASNISCFTPVFSSGKAIEIREKYRDELTWYFTEYDPTITMRVKIEEKK